MMLPKVSVIVPVYMVKPYLRRSLDSLLRQTLHEIEIIAVNDASPDGSLEVLREYAAIDPRVKVLDFPENRGSGAARNAGISTASGEFLGFMDPDDWVSDNYFYDLYKAAVNSGADIAATNNVVLSFDDGKGKRKNLKMRAPAIIEKTREKAKIVIKSGITWNKIYRRDFINKHLVKYASAPEGEDNMFNIMAVALSNKIAAISTAVYFYFQRDGAALALPKTEKHFQIINVYSDILRQACAAGLGLGWQKIIWRRATKDLANIGRKMLHDMRCRFRKQVNINLYPRSVARLMFLKSLVQLIPIKKLRRKYRDELRAELAQMKYSVVLKKIKAKYAAGIPINVAFLSSEPSKWGAGIIYEKLSKDKIFCPHVYVIRGQNTYPEKFASNLDFYKSKGLDAKLSESAEDIVKDKIDIVFYEEPWQVISRESDKSYSPYRLARFALCVYFPYAVVMAVDNNEIAKKCFGFYKSLYSTFMFNDAIVRQWSDNGIYNMLATGHPKLDIYEHPAGNGIWQSNGKLRLVYAPHHSFYSESALKWGTYLWNGRHILELAKSYPNTEWIFKPHPRFRKALRNAMSMSKKEINQLFGEWADVGQIYESGDYFNIFRGADLMISDCGSFMTEWLPTGKPMIMLVSNFPNAEPRNEVDEKNTSGYYKAHNLQELDELFEMLVVHHKDPLKEARQKLIADIPKNASGKIHDYLKGLLK